MTTDIRIRAFRAIEDPETCEKYIEGHRKVLEHHGIVKITSANEDWPTLKSIFVIVVETLDKEKLFGGAKVQAADGIHPLPIEEATGKMDPKVCEIVRYYSQFGAAELSGLWNSKEVAGFGIGSLFPSRVAVALAEQLGIDVMFSLCSPATVRFNQWIGSKILTSVGVNGTFYYPKIDLLATAVFLEDALELKNAHPREREKMFFLRKNLNSVSQEKSPFKNEMINVYYDLKIKSADKNEFKLKLDEPVLIKNNIT